MRYFTAAFGEDFRIAVTGLVRRFQASEPDASLTVFTDLQAISPASELTSLDELLSGRERFYFRPGRLNIFKYALFKRMFERYPGESIAWIDADMLVLGDLTSHLDPSRPNVISHGRRDDQVVELGNGVAVQGSKFAIGGFYSLPGRSWLDLMNRVVADRPSWNHRDHNSNSGDQVILNHVVASADPASIKWITDDKRFVFNLEIGENVHPIIGDPRLKQLTRRKDAVYLGKRQIVIFCWIKRQFDLHLADEFRSFHPDVRDPMLHMYRHPA